MSKLLQETGRITEAAVAKAKETGRLPVQLVSPGWGSSGYYSAEVLEQAVSDGLFPAGMHMYADHPTAEEARARPVRSIKDLVSVSVAEARIATDEDVASWGAELGAVVTEADVLPAWRDLALNESFSAAIGLSIRGDGELVEGEADGRTGKIVESLIHIQSTDWVTRAGRGGKVLSLVESARANARAIERGIDESTVNDTREALQTILRDAYGGGDHTWVYVRDFDDSTVWFEIDSPGDDAGIYGQEYSTADNGALALTGDRTEVRVQTTFVPVTRPGSTTTTTESKEIPMGMKQIEEAELSRLREDAGRVTALEERATTAERERDELREEKARTGRVTRAADIIEARAKEAGVSYTPLEVKGLCVDLPVKEDGGLDEAAFTKTVDEDAASRKADAGTGKVIGHGGGTVVEAGKAPTLEQIDEALGLKKGA
ncbi:hypothetical protein [Nocardioides sp. T2.26MG-1]|uniref:hypothetical protein n=1 Tax=Nocardioides sp. T2.26MG-1 TaxID=3041166 RepID=UPI0024773432|nr:hypothetical protein [Nocardioides sp. T2.26MG-1]CAI9417336.1 hypothetical protein HIDPHFAB_02994 [Nocardioides sp. T2.26MG-1]